MQYNNYFNGGIYRAIGNIEKGAGGVRKFFLEEREILVDYKCSMENFSYR